MNSNIVYIALPLMPFQHSYPEKENNKSAKSVMPTNILSKGYAIVSPEQGIASQRWYVDIGGGKANEDK